jgi:hypothetical protein
LLIEQGAIFEGSCRMKTGKAAQEKETTDKPRVKEPEVRSAPPQPINGKSAVPEMLKSSNMTG